MLTQEVVWSAENSKPRIPALVLRAEFSQSYYRVEVFCGRASIENLLLFVDSLKVRFKLRSEKLVCFKLNLILASRQAPDKSGLHRFSEIRLFQRLALSREGIGPCQGRSCRCPARIVLWAVRRQSVAIKTIGMDAIDCCFHVRAVGILMLRKSLAAEFVRGHQVEISPRVLPPLLIVLISPVKRHPFPLWTLSGESHDMNANQNRIHVAGLDAGGVAQDNISAIIGELTDRVRIGSLNVI